eukprot:982836-Rhodomonas_salina.1
MARKERTGLRAVPESTVRSFSTGHRVASRWLTDLGPKRPRPRTHPLWECSGGKQSSHSPVCDTTYISFQQRIAIAVEETSHRRNLPGPTCARSPLHLPSASSLAGLAGPGSGAERA